MHTGARPASIVPPTDTSRRGPRPAVAALVIGIATAVAGCADDAAPAPTEAASVAPTGSSDGGGTAVGATATDADRYPDIVAATAEWDPATATWSFDVTVSSPYDTPERYADGWRVLGPGGEVLGEHTLTHDHASEQPFTRRQTGVEVPDDVERVTVEGRDQQYGYGGTTLTIALER